MAEFTSLDRRYMARALRLARQGLYSTQPNPRVGCVLVRAGEIVGEGWHQVAGQGHAEVNALAQAGDCARGATAYVTLEPCSHHGKTGPCADALVAAGVARVVAAMRDPNPLVAGRGMARLQAAGIDVADGLLEPQALALNPGFIKRMRTGLPFVHIKVATSLDGRTAMASGESKWITGAAARKDVQRLRARCSAVVTGMGTQVADDPSLNVRQADIGLSDEAFSRLKQPLRVLLDSKGRLQPEAQLLSVAGELLHCTAEGQALDTDFSACEANYQHLGLAVSDVGQLNLRALLQALAERECNEVLIEAGAELAGAFVAQGLWDRLHVYMAPKLLGSNARPLLSLPFDTMAQAQALKLLDTRMLGDDIRLRYSPQN